MVNSKVFSLLLCFQLLLSNATYAAGRITDVSTSAKALETIVEIEPSVQGQEDSGPRVGLEEVQETQQSCCAKHRAAIILGVVISGMVGVSAAVLGSCACLWHE